MICNMGTSKNEGICLRVCKPFLSLTAFQIDKDNNTKRIHNNCVDKLNCEPQKT